MTGQAAAHCKGWTELWSASGQWHGFGFVLLCSLCSGFVCALIAGAGSLHELRSFDFLMFYIFDHNSISRGESCTVERVGIASSMLQTPSGK